MCGITGFVDFTRSLDLPALQKMTDSIVHRGPDDAGYEVFDHDYANIGLGHRRLSILDLSALGHQPMHYENLSVIFNGEIYNFQEIRTELISKGFSFRSDSDTEVILKAFKYWGVESFNFFNGMFAFALYNHDTHDLYLVRDRIGVKPLYYFKDDQHLVFASELKPIMLYPYFKKRINRKVLHAYLFHEYISSPHSIFQDVFKLEPGHYLHFNKGTVKISSYWKLQERFQEMSANRNQTEEQAIEKLDELITSSIQYRMISDVPLGAFLSGGIDSSLVTAMMQKVSDKPVKTFTIGFKEDKYNEANHAMAVAKHLGTDHHELYLPVNEAMELIEKIPQFYDEPFADNSQLPTMLVSRMAREKVTVALSGDGGDEFFCGYNKYDYFRRFSKLLYVSQGFHQLGKLIPPENFLPFMKRKHIRIFYSNNHKNLINNNYLHSEIFLGNLVLDTPYQVDQRYFDIIDLSDNIQEAAMLQDMITYLPDGIMHKVDRASMSVSLESREPLLDYRLLEYSFSLSHHLKMNQGEKKYILKQLLYRYVPEKIINRPKMGFTVPVYQWLRKELYFLVEKYLSKSFIEDQGLFYYPQIKKILDYFHKEPDGETYFSRLIWHLLVFQMWYKTYMQ